MTSVNDLEHSQTRLLANHIQCTVVDRDIMDFRKQIGFFLFWVFFLTIFMIPKQKNIKVLFVQLSVFQTFDIWLVFTFTTINILSNVRSRTVVQICEFIHDSLLCFLNTFSNLMSKEINALISRKKWFYLQYTWNIILLAHFFNNR